MPTPPPINGTRSASSGPRGSRAASAAKASADKKAAAEIIHQGVPPERRKPSTHTSVAAPSPPRQPLVGPSTALPPDVPEDQRAVYGAMMDEVSQQETHPVLGSGIMAKAKSVYEQYVLAQWRRGDGLGSGHLTMKSVELALQDVGVQMSAHEIKDLVFAIAQPQEVAHHNLKIQAAIGGGTASTAAPGVAASGRPDAPPAPTPSAASAVSSSTAAAGKHSAGNEGINFATFVDLLTITLADCNYSDEMRLLWHDLDADGDDTLGVEDITNALRSACLRDGGLELTAHQIAELIAELDVDSDGTVSLADFLAATNSN